MPHGTQHNHPSFVAVPPPGTEPVPLRPAADTAAPPPEDHPARGFHKVKAAQLRDDFNPNLYHYRNEYRQLPPLHACNQSCLGQQPIVIFCCAGKSTHMIYLQCGCLQLAIMTPFALMCHPHLKELCLVSWLCTLFLRICRSFICYFSCLHVFVVALHHCCLYHFVCA